MKKKHGHILLWIIGIIVLLVVLNYFGLFKIGSAYSIVTLEKGTTGKNIPYTCKLDATSCSITATIECSNLVDGESCTECKSTGDWRNVLVAQGYSPNGVSPNKRLVQCPPIGNLNAWQGCVGSKSYSCSGSYKKTTPFGQITSKTLTYTNPITGGVSSFSESINPGDKVEIIGGDNNYIDYEAIFQSECDYNQCNSPTNNGIYKCDNGKLIKTTLLESCTANNICTGGSVSDAKCTPINQCSENQCNDAKTVWDECNPSTHQFVKFHPCDPSIGETCSQASCILSYSNKDIKMIINGLESSSNSVGITTNSTIRLKYKFYSATLSPSLNVNFYIYQGNNLISSKSKTYNPTVGTYDYIDLINPGVNGYYSIYVTATINGKEVPITSKTDYLFNVGTPLNLEVRVESDAGTNLIAGKNVYIYLMPTDLNGNPLEVDTFALNVKFKGVLQSTVQPKKDSNGNILFENGKYIFTYVFPSSGSLVLDATVYRNNVPSNIFILDNLQIDSPILIATVDNPSIFGQIPPNTTKTISFTVRDKTNTLQDSTNIVKITPPGCAVPSCDILISDIASSGTGHYSLSFNFNVVGAYQVFILPSAPNFFNTQYVKMGTITVQPGAIEKKCTLSTDCATGYKCSNYQCVQDQPSWLIYLLYGGIGILVLIILFFVYRNFSKPNQDLSAGIGGL
jgi:hypothetical protein